MSKRRATVAAVLCFVAAIAIAGTYTFNDYRKTQKMSWRRRKKKQAGRDKERQQREQRSDKRTGTSK